MYMLYNMQVNIYFCGESWICFIFLIHMILSFILWCYAIKGYTTFGLFIFHLQSDCTYFVTMSTVFFYDSLAKVQIHLWMLFNNCLYTCRFIVIQAISYINLSNWMKKSFLTCWEYSPVYKYWLTLQYPAPVLISFL